MKHEVRLFVAGQVFVEEVRARNYDEAREVALARNPNATVLGVTAVYKKNSDGKKSRPRV